MVVVHAVITDAGIKVHWQNMRDAGSDRIHQAAPASSTSTSPTGPALNPLYGVVAAGRREETSSSMIMNARRSAAGAWLAPYSQSLTEQPGS